MVDFVNSETRSRWMSRIRSADTQPELVVRRALHANGLRYRLHVRQLPGTPDIVLARFGVCVFVNGCFWHHHRGCLHARIPSTNMATWTTKFRRNQERDKAARRALVQAGWRVIDVWECGIRDVKVPDLSWLPDAVRFGSKSHTQWPRRPPKPARK